MRVFLDTNVLASAAATRGLCADVLREVIASHELVVSPALLKELRRVLKEKFRAPRDAIADVVSFLQRDTIAARPSALRGVKLKDKDDLPLLSAAMNGQAQVFVTGDRELLVLGRIGDLEIVSPRQFWERLRAQPDAGRRKP